MKVLETMKVGPRLAVGFGIVLALMLVLTGVAISRMSFINTSLNQIVSGDAPKLRLVNAMRDLVRYQSVTIRDVVMQEDFAFKKKELTLARKSRTNYQAAANQLAGLLTDPDSKATLAKISALDAKVKAEVDKAIDLSLSGDVTGAGDAIRDHVRPAQAELIGALETLLAHLEASAKDSAQKAGRTYTQAWQAMAGVGVLALLVGAVAAFLIARSLLRQLGGEPTYAAAIANRIAAGDLAVEVRTEAHDRTSLLYAMREMRDSLVRIVSEVRTGTDTIDSAAGEIAAGNLELSARTEQQSSALEQTASSMEELTSIVKQNADNASQANVLASSATEIARRGGEVVHEVVQTMTAINDSARKIVDIISVIDGIAFQTNILALNAAVEAARAGEQGRGFAVVASEVRNLAQRAGAAAKEIKTLINDSVDKVDSGAKLVDQAGVTMEEIVASVKRVSSIIGEIASASQEQAAGIAQVNQAVSQMDAVTQQNAALVEEAAAASGAMQDQAGHLSQVVSVFTLAKTAPVSMVPAIHTNGVSEPARDRAQARLSDERKAA
ncbi:methyl-accepting chemotaxis protein [Massilia rhizosphaerae]|uniref:methyl-accepting chemotaxis protein n=1 Tax=Massilia rhizosphaerae TaxID=2784389 RepID=UPI0027D9849E|nr:methyl-accepting chemotaxis protein [Massilia rhizosphaerae]